MDDETRGSPIITASLIDEYMNLQRILVAADMKKEVAYQLKVVKKKLEQFGIATENLDIHQT